MDIEHVRSRFIKHFDGTTGAVYASPGRINLIGEHTDYNGGFVFPGAIDKGMIAEIKPNGTDIVRAYSIDLKDYVEFGLKEEDAPRASWEMIGFGCLGFGVRGIYFIIKKDRYYKTVNFVADFSPYRSEIWQGSTRAGE